mmetsp:Transcript_7904/g.15315  ORF Transcript_7904/g.15315 Transcript_7904/m.15315 type:complete len:878 (-) Transcript_7904:193-2826(-)
MGSVCKTCEKRTVLNSTIKVTYGTRNSQSSIGTRTEESKSRPSLSKPAIEKSAVKRRGQKGLSRKSILSMACECLTSEIVARAKSSNEIARITKALSKHFMFARLSDTDRYAMIEKMLVICVPRGSTVYEAGKAPTYFYVVEYGVLSETLNGDEVAEYTTGDCFGESAFLNRTSRKSTVKAIEMSQLWAADRDALGSALTNIGQAAYKENLAFVNSIALFEILSDLEREALLSSMTELNYLPGHTIVKEGDAGELFYVIKEGTVRCSAGGEELRHMSKGDFFGDQALLYGKGHQETVSTGEGPVKCLAISKDIFMKAVGERLSDIVLRNSIKIALSRSLVLHILTDAQTAQLSERCCIQEYEAGETVIPEGSLKGSGIWIVLRGSVTGPGMKIEPMGIIGEVELIENQTGGIPSMKAAEAANCVTYISRALIEEIVRCSMSQLKANNEAQTALRNVELYRSLSEQKFAALTSYLSIRTYDVDQVIFQEGTPANSFYIIKSGSVKVSIKGNIVRVMGAYAFFGERAMLQREKRSATVIANEATECWVLKEEDFFSVIDEHITKLLLKKINLQDEKVSLADLQMIRPLGGGMFGKVYMTQHKSKKVLYALKAVEKARVEKLDTWNSLLCERDILLQMDHIFVMKLVKTLKDSHYVYFVMECVMGRDLFDVIRELGVLKDTDAKFYGACLLLILEYFQSKKIVYRDLKPENIMVDEDGYPKLIDFGTAKITVGRTFTIVGTPHYMAPETIDGKGYTNSADLWSLGVILYEMMCGVLPFGDDEEDPYLVYELILTERLTYPSFMQAKKKVKSIIDTLMNRNPALRSAGNVSRLKAHPWFASVVWDDLLVKRVKPPYKPVLPDITVPESDLPLQSAIEVWAM